MHSWIRLFLEAQSAELNAARNTLVAYSGDLARFQSWLAAGSKTLESAERSDVEAFLISLEAEGLSTATRARNLSSVRQLYRFAFEEGLRDDHPALKIRGPGASRKLPVVLSEDEVERLIETSENTGRTPPERLRNACMVELLYATGMRVSELVSLPLMAVRGDPQFILVEGKGGKERMVPLSEPARVKLAAWLAEADRQNELARKEGGTETRFLFASRSRSTHLTRQAFYNMIKSIAVKARVDPAKVTPHKLRHAFATHLLARGADLRAIQQLLGHANVSTTEIYTHVLDERLKSLVLDHHPLENDG